MSRAADVRPLVGLVSEPGASAAARPIVRALARRVDLRSLDRCPTAPRAVLQVGSRSPVLAEAGWRAPAVAGRVLAGGVEVGACWVPFPPVAVDLGAVVPRAPFVRRRWRERLGLDPELVVVADDLRPSERDEALAHAAAAVVAAADLPLALALATPTVTTAAAAAALGLVDGVHVVTAGPHELTVAAAALAADPARAARLSTAARRFAEQHLDPVAAASRVVIALGLAAVPVGGAIAVADRLDQLATPAGAPIRRRAADAVAVLAAPVS